MIVAYRQMGSVESRPFLDVLVGSAEFRIPALVDSGASRTLFHPQVAELSHVDLSTVEPETVLIGPGLGAADVRYVTVQLNAAGLDWEAEVGFCEDVPHDWGLLGQKGFFRYFSVTFRSYDSEFEIEAIKA